VLIERPLKGAPGRLVAESLEHGRQPVLADVSRVHEPPGAVPQRVEPLFGPGSDVVESMVALGEDRGQPEHTHPPQAQTHPVAMSGKMFVQSGLEPYALQMGQSQGNIIDAFRRQGQGLGHGSRPTGTPSTTPLCGAIRGPAVAI
jgi:hypothetical protein